MDLTKISKSVHRTAKARGKYDQKRDTSSLIMDVVTELAEAARADRQLKYARIEEFVKRCHSRVDNKEYKAAYQELLKNTFEAEIADTIITLLSICCELNIDVQMYFDIVKKHNEILAYD